MTKTDWTEEAAADRTDREKHSFLQDLLNAVRAEECVENREYRGQEITGLKAGKAELSAVSFLGCRFVDCDFSKSTFMNVTWETCDFSNCRFPDCYIKYARFTDCKGDGADFKESVFTSSIIEKGSYRYTNFSGCVWDGTTVKEASFDHAFLSEMRWKKVKLDQVNFTGVDFFRTMLKGADLSTCNIEGITVSESFQEVRGMKICPVQAADIALLMGIRLC